MRLRAAVLGAVLHGSAAGLALGGGHEPTWHSVEMWRQPQGLPQNSVPNALKHAFPPGRAGELKVELRALPDRRVLLRVSDDGVGFPGDVDRRRSKSLGFQLVQALTDQLGGTFEERSGDDGGTAFEVTLAEVKYKPRVPPQ